MNYRVIARIEACVRLSRSDNPHEAALALYRAQHLVRRYGVALVDLSADARAVLVQPVMMGFDVATGPDAVAYVLGVARRHRASRRPRRWGR